MKKICLVVQESFRDIALNKLREIGVIHLEGKDIPVDLNSCAHKRKVKIDDAIGLISDLKIPKVKAKKKKKSDIEDTRPPYERRQKPIGLHRGRRAVDIYGTEEEEPYSLSAVRAPARPELSSYMLTIGKERKILKEHDAFLTSEIERIAPWGDFDPATVKEINDYGLPIYFYELSKDDFAGLDQDVTYIKIDSSKTVVHLIVIGKEIKGITPFKMPEKKLSEYVHETEIVKLELQEYEEKIKSFVNRRSSLDKEMLQVLQDIEFEDAMAVMEKVDAAPSELVSSGSKLSWLTGYLPKDDLENLKTVARENGWGLSAYDPGVEDNVPTKLKKNKFANMLSPVADFLGIVPGYREVDISGWFLIFFCVYFSMIFADGGYGLIMLILAIIGVVKTIKKGVPLPLKLLLMLSSFSVTWGVLSCSWFGIEAQHLPQFLIDISLAAISTAKTAQVVADQALVKAIVDQNMLLLCFSLGLLHLSIAHVIRIVNMLRKPSPVILAEIGALAMVWGMYNVVLFIMVSNDYKTFPILPISMYLLAGGFILNFVFGAYERNIGQSILDGLKNIIGVVLGVTGVFSDIMSYIRLWAVAIAGAAISETVNTMAGPMLGSFLIFLGVVLLVFGHGLNMILTVLSVLVHGIRLNTLEFSSHLKLTWSGIAYKPFALKR
jgi:V/A-type H+-transporting ATPase subunit I